MRQPGIADFKEGALEQKGEQYTGVCCVNRELVMYPGRRKSLSKANKNVECWLRGVAASG